MKRCFYCAEDIQDAAIKCRYCGSMLPVVQKQSVVETKPKILVDKAVLNVTQVVDNKAKETESMEEYVKKLDSQGSMGSVSAYQRQVPVGGGNFELNKYYEEKYGYSVFDWVNISIMTGSLIPGWIFGYYSSLDGNVGHFWTTLSVFFLIGTAISWVRISKITGAKDAIGPLIIQCFLSITIGAVMLIISLLLSGNDKNRKSY